MSMIRYMGGKGQSSDPSGPAYDPDGLRIGAIGVSGLPGEEDERLALEAIAKVGLSSE